MVRLADWCRILGLVCVTKPSLLSPARRHLVPDYMLRSDCPVDNPMSSRGSSQKLPLSGFAREKTPQPSVTVTSGDFAVVATSSICTGARW
jgi:hypothetical protein